MPNFSLRWCDSHVRQPWGSRNKQNQMKQTSLLKLGFKKMWNATGFGTWPQLFMAGFRLCRWIDHGAGSSLPCRPLQAPAGPCMIHKEQTNKPCFKNPTKVKPSARGLSKRWRFYFGQTVTPCHTQLQVIRFEGLLVASLASQALRDHPSPRHVAGPEIQHSSLSIGPIGGKGSASNMALLRSSDSKGCIFFPPSAASARMFWLRRQTCGSEPRD